MNSQNLLVDLGDQLFETRTWLAGKKTKKQNQHTYTHTLKQFFTLGGVQPAISIIACFYVTNIRLTLKDMIPVNAQRSGPAPA